MEVPSVEPLVGDEGLESALLGAVELVVVHHLRLRVCYKITKNINSSQRKDQNTGKM